MSNSVDTFDVNPLIQRVRAGDQQAFLELLERYKPLLKSLVLKFQNDEFTRSFGEDMLQEATVVFYNAILTYDYNQTEVEFGLYARICISNALVSQLRCLNKRRVEHPTEPASSQLLVDDEVVNPVEDIVGQENLRFLYTVIKKNLSDYEYIIWHHYMLGKTAKDIALSVGSNERSVSNAIYRIRKKLRELLK